MPDPNDSIRAELYLDPASTKFYGDRLFELESAQFAGQDLNAPYVYLRDALEARGVRVRTIDFLPEEESIEPPRLYVALSTLENYRKLSRRRDLTLSACIAMECPVVDPRLYKRLRKASESFRRIFSWSDSASLEPFVGAPIDVEPFFWPQSFGDVYEPVWSNTDREFLIMMNSNKLPALYVNELYTERLKAVEFFADRGEIDLYGSGWGKASMRLGKSWVPWTIRRMRMVLLEYWDRFRPDPRLLAARRVYRGRADSKRDTLGRYTFAICFENSILKGWITEKLFDCFHTGTVPVYWGAPDITDHVPKECFVDMRDFSSYGDLRDHLRSMSTADVRTYKEAARAFLGSERFRPFSLEAFAELFVRILKEDAHI